MDARVKPGHDVDRPMQTNWKLRLHRRKGG